ncbi:HTH-type transcriptional repressor of NAD biosynthesis genes [Hymenobacter luteus]|uniref:HTH-type transcriptional repressor of NAD biosynthesis genes n=2 Tax=Hymenobacter TaxID=89966 RepID=A0A7W9T0F6_9BACT|nr:MULTISPECIES: AAA family ATPase [Hymenobacter]MBB4600995.1 HTH-type transcriptional repressor of NAD biosynthesis genes [Hymenobacter latericoloratus]MBB6058798.1 HTH-type transcriptional repressor of NAD biosynthesis genes [Hymenobacter luteus]
MTHAFVFGKFLPFHQGHAALIDFARRHCDYLTVLVCASNHETLPGTLRAQWIQDTYAHCPEVSVQVLDYREEELPNTSVSSEAVAHVWADTFREVVPGVSLVVTSEPYGALVAARMGIRHLDFDRVRAQVPVSATAIRQGMRAQWSYLPAAVQSYYRRTVAILGTESTGKTTLTEQLAAHFGASFVTEAGRDLISDSTSFNRADLLLVADEHARRIAAARTTAGPLLLLDTDIHITQSYAQLTQGAYLPVPAETYVRNRADLYLYLLPDVPFVQDGTRLPAAERLHLDEIHRQTLSDFGIEYKEIGGDWPARFQQAVALIEEMLRAAGTL